MPITLALWHSAAFQVNPAFMAMRTLFFLVCLVGMFTACSKAQHGEKVSAAAKVADSRSSTRAYHHQLNLETERAAISGILTQLQALCQARSTTECVMLESQQSSGRYASASLKFRAVPELAKSLQETAGKLATLTERSTSAEELQGPLHDIQKQSELLQDYRQRLEGLRERAKNDVDALIKVHKELAQVQQDLESLQGRQQHLVQRTQTELVSLRLQSSDQTALSAPLVQALSDFARNLAQGGATAITALAYLLPWTLLLLAGFTLLRKIWHWRKQRRVPVSL